jgi:DNA helicase HerA-like ATPase
LEEGFPKMTVEHMYDVVRFLAEKAQDISATTPKTTAFTLADCNAALGKEKPTSFTSWRKVQGYLGRLLRLGLFDDPSCPSPDYVRMTEPGRVSIVDLNDTDSPMVRNLVISQILRGVQKQQDLNYKGQTPGATPRKVVIIIEEAHEFLHRDRIAKMDQLFQQVAKIARRGRKKWLGLLFSTQFPQHLPDEVLALLNTFFLHKISDANVISRLSRSIGGIDDGLWGRLSGLSAGQAIVSAPSMTRPLLVSLDPTPCKLLMVE